MAKADNDHVTRQRKSRRMRAHGWPSGEITHVIAAIRLEQQRRRRAGIVGRALPAAPFAVAATPHEAWRTRHPRLSETTIRVVIAELRRNRTGAA